MKDTNAIATEVPEIIQQIEANMVFRIRPGVAADSILYIHGLGESGLCFEKLIQSPRLAQWTHFVPDLTGYGKSPGRTPVSLAAHAENLARWVKFRQVSPVILFGHSMGGVIGQIFCENYPELVRAFVNVEGNISLGDCSFSSQVARYPEGDFLADGFQSLLDSIYLGGVTDLTLRGYYASMRLCDPRTFYLNSVELVGASTAETLARRLGKLKIPVIYLLGHPRGTGNHSQALLEAAGVTYQKIDDAGHWPFLDQPALFLEALHPFLNSLG
jgi:pimeloyl-ACP methyl ester carboxylesterase